MKISRSQQNEYGACLFPSGVVLEHHLGSEFQVRTYFAYGKNLDGWQEIESYWTAARRGLLGDQHMLDQIANFDVARMQSVDWRKAREILKCFERKKTMNDLRAEYSCFVLFQWVKAVLAICEAVDVPTTVPSAGEQQAFQDNLPATIF